MTGFPSFGTTAQQTRTSSDSGLELIIDLSPALFDQLTKILNLLQDNDVISIKNSQIIQTMKFGSTFFTSNIESLIGPNINLDFTNPKRVISIFKLIKSSSNIKIFDEPDMNRYKLVSDEAIFHLIKPAQEVENTQAVIPAFDDLTIIGKAVTLMGDSKTRAKNYISKSEKDFVNLLIEQDQIKAVYIPDDIIYHFPDFKNPNLTNANAELMLKSYSFLNIDGEEFYIHLTKHNDKYVIVTQVKTAFEKIIIDVYEYVDVDSFENMFT